MKQLFFISVLFLTGACDDRDYDADEQVATLPLPAAIDVYEEPAASNSYAEARAAAVAAIEVSAARGHEWSTSGALLEEGAAAQDSGDDELAIRLTDRARIQAELSIRQADIEESAWKDRVLSD